MAKDMEELICTLQFQELQRLFPTLWPIVLLFLLMSTLVGSSIIAKWELNDQQHLNLSKPMRYLRLFGASSFGGLIGLVCAFCCIMLWPITCIGMIVALFAFCSNYVEIKQL